jgi:transcriptional regulator with XRE-family HTH domain
LVEDDRRRCADREEGALMLLRSLLGDALRRQRLRQSRTLREVSADARVSLGYLSEVERGQKEASSELLSSICDALGVKLSTVLREVSDELHTLEVAEDDVRLAHALVAMPADAEHVSALTAQQIGGQSQARATGHQVVAAA